VAPEGDADFTSRDQGVKGTYPGEVSLLAKVGHWPTFVGAMASNLSPDLDLDLDLDLDHDHDHELDHELDPVLEVVDELVFDAVDEGAADAYSIFVAALTDVALGFGADPVGVDRLRGMLGETRVDGLSADAGTRAWRNIIRGQAEDFSECGARTLDEWAADVVAHVVGGARTDAIRRELRKRGVAAFGFMAEAA
jgi:hypothetical protein